MFSSRSCLPTPERIGSSHPRSPRLCRIPSYTTPTVLASRTSAPRCRFPRRRLLLCTRSRWRRSCLQPVFRHCRYNHRHPLRASDCIPLPTACRSRTPHAGMILMAHGSNRAQSCSAQSCLMYASLAAIAQCKQRTSTSTSTSTSTRLDSYIAGIENMRLLLWPPKPNELLAAARMLAVRA